MTKAHKSVLDGVVETVTVGASLSVNNTDPKNPIINAIIANQATAEAGTNNTQLMTALGVAQSIAKNSPPTDTSALALALADLQGQRLIMKGGVADPFDDETGVNGADIYTKLSLSFNGTNGSTTFIDNAQQPISLTNNGSTSISTTQSKFGGASLRLNSNSSNFLWSNASPNFNMPGNYTVEFWIWISATQPGTAPNAIIDFRNANGTNHPYILLDATGKIVYYSSSAMRATSATLTREQWHHVALVRSQGLATLYVNGSSVGPAFSDATIFTGNYLTLGTFIDQRLAGPAYKFDGYIDDLRISVDIARYTSNFIPPTQSFSVTNGLSLNQIYDPSLDYYRPFATATTTVVPTMTGFTTNGVTFSASTTYPGGYEAWRAGDKTANFWASNTVAAPHWLKIDLGTARAIGSYAIQARTDVLRSTDIRSFNFEGSNNDADWTILDTRIDLNWTASEIKTYYISNTESFRYYRIYATSGTGGATDGVVISEIEMSTAPIYSNLTLVSVPYPTTTQPNYARLVLQIDTPLTIAPNTDLQGQVSRDGGTTWATANLQLASTLGNIKTYQDDAVDLSGIGAGTNIVWRARTLTNKNIPISGVVTQWR